MTTGKPTPAELAAAAYSIQVQMDAKVASIERQIHDDNPDAERRRWLRSKIVVYDRLSKALARIIANGAAEGERKANDG